MLWSLIKIVLFVVLVAALAWGAGFLLESEGGIQLTVAGTEYTLGPLQSVIAVLLLMFAVWGRFAFDVRGLGAAQDRGAAVGGLAFPERG